MNPSSKLSNYVTSRLRSATNSWPRRSGAGALCVALGGLVFLQSAAAVSPAPDGGYPFENTAEGDYALQNLQIGGSQNVAVGTAALYSDTAGSFNTAVGRYALYTNQTGSYNTAIGVDALLLNTGYNNTAVGGQALYSNTTGEQNSALGVNALYANTEGSRNTALGFYALTASTSATDNTAVGHQALFKNNIGIENSAVGSGALHSNTNGVQNSAFGMDTLYTNLNGSFNTAAGWQALYSNKGGAENVATGWQALYSNVGGTYNIAMGVSALTKNVSGDYNIAIGGEALFSSKGNNNTACGHHALNNNTTGNNNIAVGAAAGLKLTTGSNNIDIGANGTEGESNTIRIGKGDFQKTTYIQGIFGSTVASGVQVVANSAGKLGTIVSSARYKEAIAPMGDASDALLALKPVTFRYKQELDPDRIPQFGLVAEEVEKVSPDLVMRDAEGKVNTVRYEAVNAMLLNEFLKAHHKVEEATRVNEGQQAEIAALKEANAKQQKQIEALTAGLEKVASRIGRNETNRQVVANDSSVAR